MGVGRRMGMGMRMVLSDDAPKVLNAVTVMVW